MHNSLKQFFCWYWPSALLFNAFALILMIMGVLGESKVQGDFFNMAVQYEKGLFVFLIGNLVAAMWASTKIKPSKEMKI